MKNKRTIKECVKEAIDYLPNGICFFDKKEHIVLCNHTMYRLAFSLTGRDLQTLSELKTAIDGHTAEAGCKWENDMCILPDGTAWQFSEATVTDRYGKCYTQVIATDITEFYKSKIQLEEGNKKLALYRDNIHRLSANINAVTREEEILNLKMRVHDDIGRSIIAARKFLLSGRPINEFDMSVWKNALQLLKNGSDDTKDKNTLDELTEAAAGIGIQIKTTGELPEDNAISYLFIMAMRECATNAVRHAGATELYAKIIRLDNVAEITITNNGAVPLNNITEGGGFTSLRTRIERAGGSMTIRSKPFFSLTVTAPLRKTNY